VSAEADIEGRAGRFRAAHPQIAILVLGRPSAWLDCEKIAEAATPAALLDELEYRFPRA
jgi:hypothetical protein